jgi:hypothetical protein
MKVKYIFSIAIMFALCTESINAQFVVPIQKAELTRNSSSVLNQHLSAYTIFTMEKSELINNLFTDSRAVFQICIDENLDWTFDLQLNDMRSPDFKQTYVTDEGEFEFNEPFIVNTFKGYTTDGRVARFTIDENTFFGVILGDRYHYVIRPAKDYTQNSEDRSFIVYKSSDIIFNEENLDYLHDVLREPKNDELETVEQDILKNTTDYVHCTYYLRIATDADFQFYQAMGNNLINTYSRIFSDLNVIEGVYESTFDMKFIITFQNVFITNTTYTEMTNGSKLLDQFRDHWEKNRKGVTRNMAHLFSGKNLNVNGMAEGLGHINDSKSYALSRLRQEMYQTTAHEIGHLLDAYDVNLMNPVPPECLCGDTLASVMCQGLKRSNLWFCERSISEIVPFISKKRSYLINPIPANQTLSGSVTGFQAHEAGQTITSTQVINSGVTSYKAGEKITLGPGFKVEAGARFSASVEEVSDCVGPIRAIASSTSMCSGDAFWFFVPNATRYSVRVTNLLGIQVHSANGSITNNLVTAWVSSSVFSVTWYTVNITFYSQHHHLSQTYTVWVNPCF